MKHGEQRVGHVRVEREDKVGWIIFDHVARRNALSRAMWAAIPEAVRTLDEDTSVRVLILRGAGEVAFVSGADISEFEANRIGPGAADYNALTEAAFMALSNAKKPVLAMIHGFCIGGGAAVSLCADMRYAADDAVFAIPPARLGLGYGTRNIARLLTVVGQANAREILFTARRYSATEALAMGLVQRVLPKAALERSVRAMAMAIAERAPLTLQSAKLNLGELSKPWAHQDRAAMQASIDACFASEDYAEGVRAFLEKRKAIFQGR